MEIAFLCLILIYLTMEKIFHERRLKRIPIRIHVNGTRGKSNVVRLIAAALRRSGIRTLAKTTGTLPRLILPDGRVETIRRRSPANILEQMKIIKKADRLKTKAIVIECMALNPSLQFISETAMIRSTVGIITNVRPDHFEVMGNSLDEVAEALSESIPEGGILVTGDRRYFPFFSQVASRRGSRAVLASEASPSGEERGICLFEENIGIVLSVCSILGLDPAVVAPSLDQTIMEGEGAGIFRLALRNKTVHFVDAFSANDIDSTRMIQERALARNLCPRPWIALFNNRADRPLRLKSFANGLLTGDLYDYIALTGEGLHLAQQAMRGRVAPERCFVLANTSPQSLLEALFTHVSCAECTIVGMGNEKGLGGRLSQFFKEKEA